MVLMLALLLNASSANAAEFDAELAIPSEHPQWMKAAYAPSYSRYLIKLAALDSPGDLVASSTDPRVGCRVQDDWVILSFQSNRADWPTTFPVLATCTVGEDVLRVSLVEFDPAVDPAHQEMKIQTGDVVNLVRVTDALVRRTYALPECDAPYLKGTYTATGIDGVTCSVYHRRGGEQVVQLRVLPDATMGAGVCTLPLRDSTSYTLTINLDESAP